MIISAVAPPMALTISLAVICALLAVAIAVVCAFIVRSVLKNRQFMSKDEYSRVAETPETPSQNKKSRHKAKRKQGGEV